MREVGAPIVFHKWGQKEDGFEISGKYVRLRSGAQDKYGKDQWVLRDSDYQEHNLGHSGQLANRMAGCKLGQNILVKYLGMKQINSAKQGLTDAHQFKVFILDKADDGFADLEDIGEREIMEEGFDAPSEATQANAPATQEEEDDAWIYADEDEDVGETVEGADAAGYSDLDGLDV